MQTVIFGKHPLVLCYTYETCTHNAGAGTNLSLYYHLYPLKKFTIHIYGSIPELFMSQCIFDLVPRTFPK